MGHPAAFQITQGHGPQLAEGQVSQVRRRAVEPLPQYLSVHRRGQQAAPLSPGQLLPQVRGGYVHHAGNGQGEQPRLGIGFVQIVPLDGEELLRVRLRAAEGGDARQG